MDLKKIKLLEPDLPEDSQVLTFLSTLISNLTNEIDSLKEIFDREFRLVQLSNNSTNAFLDNQKKYYHK